MKVTNIKMECFTEYIGVEYFGIDKSLFLSWKFMGEGENAFQKSYQIKVRKSGTEIYDTGIVKNACHMGIELKSLELQSFKEYQIQVIIEDLSGDRAESEWVSFVTGTVNSDDFKGKWIGTGGDKPFYARKECSISKEIESAYAVVCGSGQFLLYVNPLYQGRRVLFRG